MVGDPEQRARPWGTVFRLPTDDGGAAWSKANGPGPFHEAALVARLHERGEDAVLPPLAVDLDRGWLLTDDGGHTLRDATTADGRPGDQDLDAWLRVLPAYAAFQRRVAGDSEAFLALGVPDERPARYPAILAAQLDTDALWSRVDAPDRPRTDEARRRLGAMLGRIEDLAHELAASPVGASLDHGDLHGNNILPRPDGRFRYFDWGDAVVAHPFASLTTALGSLTYHMGLDLDGPELARLRDAYTEAWTDVASRAELERAALLAVDLGSIGKTAAWERALQGLEPDEMGGHHGASAAWLADTVERFERFERDGRS